MITAFIFINSKIRKDFIKRIAIKQDDLLIGVDGGAKNIMEMGRLPDIVLGDFDSLNDSVFGQLLQKKVPLIKYPKDKDFTDSQIALDFVLQQKVKKVIFIGLSGTRLDHIVTNLLFASHPKYKILDISFWDFQQKIYFIRKYVRFHGQKNDIVSLIPLLNDVSGITTSGLKYSLQKAVLYFGNSRGISNLMTDKTVEISIKSGLLMIIHQQKNRTRGLL
jgi:thiamine pyrophosphokinase